MLFNKFSKKNKNIIAGLLVGVTSLYVVINYTKMPADDVRDFFLATFLFFLGIIVLATVAVVFFKMISKLLSRIFADKDE